MYLINNIIFFSFTCYSNIIANYGRDFEDFCIAGQPHAKIKYVDSENPKWSQNIPYIVSQNLQVNFSAGTNLACKKQ